MITDSPTSNSNPTELAQTLELPGGRKLSYATFGPATGPLVVILDGPGSRGLARAAAPIAEQAGVRLVAPDRPGFFDSTPAPGRSIADWPADPAALLDALGAGRAGIVGQSGGTPYALAAAAALPERTLGLALIGAVAPLCEPQNLADASSQIRGGANLSRRAPWLLRLMLRGMGRKALRNPEGVARKMVDELPPADQAVMEDPRLWALHVQATGEVLGRPDALAHEIGLLARPWGVDLTGIQVPASLWVGELDRTHPVSHSRRLAERLDNAPVHVIPGAATFAMLPIYPAALRFASGG